MVKLFLIFLSLSTVAHAAISRLVTGSGGSPIATTYNTSSQSLVFANKPVYRQALIHNTSTSKIACKLNHRVATPVPVITQSEEIIVPPATSYIFNGITLGPNVFCRAVGTPVVSEGILITAW